MVSEVKHPTTQVKMAYVVIPSSTRMLHAIPGGLTSVIARPQLHRDL